MNSSWTVEVTVTVNAKDHADARKHVNAQLGGSGRITGILIGDTKEAPPPWNPIRTAPKNGRKFIGIDANIDLAQTTHWHAGREEWVNFDGDRFEFTHWIPQRPL